MQHLDGTSETVATTLSLWIAGVWYPISSKSGWLDEISSRPGRYSLVGLQMRQLAQSSVEIMAQQWKAPVAPAKLAIAARRAFRVLIPEPKLKMLGPRGEDLPSGRQLVRVHDRGTVVKIKGRSVKPYSTRISAVSATFCVFTATRICISLVCSITIVSEQDPHNQKCCSRRGRPPAADLGGFGSGRSKTKILPSRR
jgi:hypothetical protein